MPYFYNTYARFRYSCAANDYSQVMQNLSANAETIIAELESKIDRNLEYLDACNKKVEKRLAFIEKRKKGRPISAVSVAIATSDSTVKLVKGAERVQSLMEVIFYLKALTVKLDDSQAYCHEVLSKMNKNSKLKSSLARVLKAPTIDTSFSNDQEKIEGLQHLLTQAKKHTIKPLSTYVPTWLSPPSHTYRLLSQFENRYGLHKKLERPPCSKNSRFMDAYHYCFGGVVNKFTAVNQKSATLAN